MAGQTTKDSWRILRQYAGHLRKVICYQLGRKDGIVDKWLLQPPSTAAAADQNGIPNPLDHVLAIYSIVASDSPDNADALIDWLCRQCGGRFVRPAPGQRTLVADANEAALALSRLYEELKRKTPRPDHVRHLRRTIQNYIDLTAEAPVK